MAERETRAPGMERGAHAEMRYKTSIRQLNSDNTISFKISFHLPFIFGLNIRVFHKMAFLVVVRVCFRFFQDILGATMLGHNFLRNKLRIQIF